MRDIIAVPFEGENMLLIACDNSGAIGMKEQDHVHVPYETLSYYSFRTAVMECMAAGGQPLSVILHNFCDNDAWLELVKGIQKGLAELSLQNVPITGSTESNFSLMQSAIGVEVLGKKPHSKETEITYTPQLRFAVIGMPLVGVEVIEKEDKIAPLSIFSKVCKLKDVMVWPVGSKGILYELNQMFQGVTFMKVNTNLDLVKSSGPSTCFIIVYHPSREDEIKRITEGFFHSLEMLV